MGDFWQRNVAEPGKLPLLLCFAAFVVTFLTTRTITRLIRSGRGPFHDNVSSSGVHVHHAVPGIVLLITGAMLAIASAGSPGREFAAVLVGVGASLVLDEFALILHLEDVYWTTEGRVSVQMVSIAVACMGVALVGAAPFGVDDVGSTELGLRSTALVLIVANVVLVAITVLKGKYVLALLGIFVPFASALGAVRLARPTSRWAGRYDAAELAEAKRRAARRDARWDPIGDRLADFVGGSMDAPAPPLGPGPTG